MLASFILAMREGLEAALVVGILLAALKKTGSADLARPVWRGVVTALLFSLIAALGLNALGAEFEGRGEQLFEGITMLLAAALLTWVIFWMRRQALARKRNLEEGINRAVLQGNAGSLFGLAFLAVAREGLELALFLLAARQASSPLQVLTGALLGLSLAAALGWMLFTSSRRLRLEQFFMVTNFLLVFFAAGLLMRAAGEFIEAGVLPAFIDHLWDLTPLLSEKGLVGGLLSALFGYTASPSLTQALTYLVYFLGLGLVWKRLTGKTPAAISIGG